MGTLSSAKFRFILLSLLLTGCGSSLPGKIGENADAKASSVSGKVSLVGSTQELDLGSTNRAMVLIFASDSCVVCAREADHFVAEFAKRGGYPSNITFLTIMVGAFLEDAIAWRDFHRITWPLAIDNGDTLFRTACTGTTPCVLTVAPNRQIIRVRTGEVNLSNLEEETGPWLY
jgi:hypothetical protein